MNTRTSCSYFLIVGTSWPEQHLNAQYDSSSSLLRCWLSNWARTLDYEYANFISELSKSCIDSDSSFHSIKCLVDEVFAERTGGTQVKLSKRFHPMTKDEFGVMSAECCLLGSDYIGLGSHLGVRSSISCGPDTRCESQLEGRRLTSAHSAPSHSNQRDCQGRGKFDELASWRFLCQCGCRSAVIATSSSYQKWVAFKLTRHVPAFPGKFTMYLAAMIEVCEYRDAYCSRFLEDRGHVGNLRIKES